MTDLIKASNALQVKFWGTRGSIACPGADRVRYGGDTACVHIRHGDRLVILDAGTGLRRLGDALAAQGPVDVDILLSHCHLDHIAGLPFFAPLFIPGNSVRLWAGSVDPAFRLGEVVDRLVAPPLFPLTTQEFKADVSYRSFVPGETIDLGLTIRTAPLNHPGGSVGYRIEAAGKAVAYLTDVELDEAPFDPGVTMLAQGADLLIFDTMFEPEDMADKEGWGHSSWQSGVRLADAMGVGTLCLFHHNPAHDDMSMDRILRRTQSERAATIAAQDGLDMMI